MIAAVASEEPEIEAKPAQPPTAAIAIPPRRWPSHALAAWNSDWLIPALAANCPISRNSGTTERSSLVNRQ